jgi:hypothetical protein
MSCWQRSSKCRVRSLNKYLVVVCWFPFKGRGTADVCPGRCSLKNDKPDTSNTMKAFSYASVFQATLALVTSLRTGVVLWHDNLVCIVFTWLLHFVINFDIRYQLSVAFFSTYLVHEFLSPQSAPSRKNTLSPAIFLASAAV